MALSRILDSRIHVLLFLFSLCRCVQSLWPIPRSLQAGPNALVLSPDFDIQSRLSATPADLSEAVNRTKSFLLHDRLQRLVVGRGASDSSAIESAKHLHILSMELSKGATVRNISEEAIIGLSMRSEEYTLYIPDDGSEAVLKANSTLGLLRGLTTFEQMWYDLDDQIYTLETPISISDSPAYVRKRKPLLAVIRSAHSRSISPIEASCSTRPETCACLTYLRLDIA